MIGSGSRRESKYPKRGILVAIYALADLHLSLSEAKPMDIFGLRWKDHTAKIASAWASVIGEEDLVVIPGDISWAMRLEQAEIDLSWIAELPGKKLLVRGNHDYWWQSVSRLRAVLPKGIYALQNDYFAWGKWAVCGSRGWICPGEKQFNPESDQKIYLRELRRLERSLCSAVKDGHEFLIVALHYPPVNSNHEPSGFTALLGAYPVKICVYGHLHAVKNANAITGVRNGVEYRLVAADAVDFCPQLLVT